MATRLSNAMSEALKVIHEGGFAWGEYVGTVFVAFRASITPSGLKALNDVRAATGSELYKDNMP